MRELFESAAKIWAIDRNVLIQGESGTGRSLARAIHSNSAARGRPLSASTAAVRGDHCNELFGHERGATPRRYDANWAHGGAQKGTLFLDEVGEMPLSMQVKLLRVLQERTLLLRVGGLTGSTRYQDHLRHQQGPRAGDR
jgi:two-component system NtrC family response regulator